MLGLSPISPSGLLATRPSTSPARISPVEVRVDQDTDGVDPIWEISGGTFGDRPTLPSRNDRIFR